MPPRTVSALGVLTGRGRHGSALTAGRLSPGRPQHACRAEHLIGLDQHAECPFLAADVGMEGLALPAIRVADLLERRIRRDAKHDLRVDVKAEGRQGGGPLASSFSMPRLCTLPWYAAGRSSNHKREQSASHWVIKIPPWPFDRWPGGCADTTLGRRFALQRRVPIHVISGGRPAGSG